MVAEFRPFIPIRRYFLLRRLSSPNFSDRSTHVPQQHRVGEEISYMNVKTRSNNFDRLPHVDAVQRIIDFHIIPNDPNRLDMIYGGYKDYDKKQADLNEEAVRKAYRKFKRQHRRAYRYLQDTYTLRTLTDTRSTSISDIDSPEVYFYEKLIKGRKGVEKVRRNWEALSPEKQEAIEQRRMLALSFAFDEVFATATAIRFGRQGQPNGEDRRAIRNAVTH